MSQHTCKTSEILEPHVLCQEGWPLRQQDWPFGLKETHMAQGTGFWECYTDLDERAM
jgi:hypothetical protein